MKEKFDDQLTSDVVVRLRTKGGRDDRFYCHSRPLSQGCRFFAERLSPDWPTLQLIDSRCCIEVYYPEPDVNHYVNFLRLLYESSHSGTKFNGVRNTLGILQVAILLGGDLIAKECSEYLEASPWEESEEEELLRLLPKLGPHGEFILARLQPVDSTSLLEVFFAALRLATSIVLPRSIDHPKITAQEQLEYMLTEDDDAPLLITNELLKCEVLACLGKLFLSLRDDIQMITFDGINGDAAERLTIRLSDFVWFTVILSKLDLMNYFLESWFSTAEKMIELFERINMDSTCDHHEMKLNVAVVTSKVLDVVANGVVVLPAMKRLELISVWLPFIRNTKLELDKIGENVQMDEDLCSSLESAFVSLVVSLPSPDQANIFTEWLKHEQVSFPDLSEAFQMWCHRSKAAKRKLISKETHE